MATTDGTAAACAFLQSVFGQALDDGPGLLSIHTLQPLRDGQDRRTLATRWYESIDEAAAHAARQGAAGTGNDVYVGACVGREKPKKGRGDETLIRCVPALWADIDVRGTGHNDQKAYPPTYEAAADVLVKVGVRPTMVIDSGYGLWGWWVFTEPIELPGDMSVEAAQALSERWHLTIKCVARGMGYTIDSVYDLTRIARMPGTHNHKGEAPRLAGEYQVMGLASGQTYNPEDLEPFMVAPELMDASRDDHQRIEIDAVDLSEGRAFGADLLAIAIANDPQFEKTWSRDRKDLRDQSGSAYDLALSNFGVKCGFTDQQIADMILTFRRTHGLDEAKARRRDYVQRTIAKARSMGMQASAVQELNDPGEAEAGPPPAGTPEHDDWKTAKLDMITRALWGVKVLAFIQVGRENSIYYIVIRTKDGPKEIKIGGLSAVRDPAKFTEPITNWTRTPLPRFKAATWDGVYRNLLAICETQESPELHDAVTGRGYVVEYLRRSAIAVTAREATDAAEAGKPFIRDGLLHLHADTLRRHLRQRQDVTIAKRDLTHLLREAGFASKSVSYRPDDGSGPTSRYYWSVVLDDIVGDLPPSVQAKLRPSAVDEEGELPI